jgi:hypothetical protein
LFISRKACQISERENLELKEAGRGAESLYRELRLKRQEQTVTEPRREP